MVRLTDRPDMTLDVYLGRKTTMQQQQSSETDISSKEVPHVKLVITQEVHKSLYSGTT